MEKLLLTAEEAATALGISRSRVYRLIQCGELNSIKIGGIRRIPATSAEKYVADKLAAVTDDVA